MIVVIQIRRGEMEVGIFKRRAEIVGCRSGSNVECPEMSNPEFKSSI